MTDRPTRPLATGPLGMSLLSFHRVAPETRFRDAPLKYVLVALWHGDRLLLVHVRGRECWELPGGGIEPGESPQEAAARELHEESGQLADAGGHRAGLRFVGFSRTAIGPEQRVLYGALFTGETSAPRPFVPTDEVSAIHWHRGTERPPDGGQMQTVDTYLAGLCRPGRP